MRKPVIGLLASVCLGGLVLAACSSGSPTATTVTTTTPTTAAPSTTSTTAAHATTTTAASGTAACTTANLTASVYGSSGAAGTIETTIALKSTLSTSCTFGGYPGLGMTGSNGASLTTTVVRKGNYPFTAMAPITVTLAPGQSAYFNMGYSDVPTGSATSCPAAANLVITPPNSYTSLTIPAQLTPCNNGTITVSPVFLATSPGAQTTAPPSAQ
ncbi:MAG TPA: DUF4232 domain-containing protein [Acidimicrobiales bacterium]|jgi:hypothetical protein|nr:DUF4232 domain-containing protein [Acidimicrobiales bacterium]